ncbi:MAG: hypothetical protein EZS28_000158 [Streblomastix strix]|uniref:Uncharacterized protein n=1 Tax=Streblomastix strix TaxID=222440 RepID=A0A5J4XCS3_9EUKA|nr:MAG: hypothetical protein EZS28_000158 [Streblomastix strix]
MSNIVSEMIEYLRTLDKRRTHKIDFSNLSMKRHQLEALLPDLALFQELEILDLSQNSIDSLPDLRQLQKLKTLKLVGNPVVRVPKFQEDIIHSGILIPTTNVHVGQGKIIQVRNMNVSDVFQKEDLDEVTRIFDKILKNSAQFRKTQIISGENYPQKDLDEDDVDKIPIDEQIQTSNEIKFSEFESHAANIIADLTQISNSLPSHSPFHVSSVICSRAEMLNACFIEFSSYLQRICLRYQAAQQNFSKYQKEKLNNKEQDKDTWNKKTNLKQ